MGYDAEWGVLGAAEVGANHQRDRIWILADSNSERGPLSTARQLATKQVLGCYGSSEWWTVEPGVGRVAHGVASRVDRLKALGNGQVPQCHAEAWRRLILRGL
jgi:DNA (cytosine-5)-methyltransferase 1